MVGLALLVAALAIAVAVDLRKPKGIAGGLVVLGTILVGVVTLYLSASVS